MRCRNDALAEPRDNDYNRAHRYTTYRQYVMCIHGRIGAETETLFQAAVCGASVTDILSLPVNMQDILKESLIKVQLDSNLVVGSFMLFIMSFIFTPKKLINYKAFSFWHYDKHQKELRYLITIIEYIMRLSKFTRIFTRLLTVDYQ